MKPSKIHNCINLKLVTLKYLRFLSSYLLNIIVSEVFKLECSERAQMKDFLKPSLKTIMDFSYQAITNQKIASCFFGNGKRDRQSLSVVVQEKGTDRETDGEA